MIFLNQLLIWGGAAFLIPLAIHLLNRSRYRTIDWGAMHLLESVIKVNHKRFRIEQLILLLIRCAIPVLLALCLARPVLTDAGILEGDTPVSLVIVLDNSYSMDTVEATGSRFEQAVAAASDIIGATQRGSEVAIILTGGTPTPLFDQPVFDADAVIRRLGQVSGGMGASDIPGALDDALATLSGMSHARRELVVISDFQPQDWQDVELQGAAFREKLAATDVPIFMTLLPIGKPATGNLAIESLDYTGRALGVGQTLNVRATLRNLGAIATGTTRVVMRIDGQETAVSQVTLPADSTTQLLFPCQFDSPGSHVLEVELIADDPLPTDNRYAAAVNVWERVPVLLVDGDPNPQPLQGETDFLAIALTPYTLGRMQIADLLETRTVSAQELSEASLEDVRVVVMANVSRLDEPQVFALQQFVARGGALLVCLGNRIDLNWYNQSMYAQGAGLLPASIGRLRGKAEDSTSVAASETGSQVGETQIVVQHFEHPALTLFNDPNQGDLATAKIRQWYELKTAEDEMTDSSSVMAWLNTGEPLIVERPFKNGFVVMMATACDDDWSDLPLKPAYVPLMQQLVATLAASVSPPQNFTTGEPAITILEPDVDQDPSVESNTATIVLPGGGQRTVSAMEQGERRVIRFDATQRPGVYTLTTPAAETVHFVATTSRVESEPGVLENVQVTDLATQLTAEVVPSPSQYIEQDRLRRHGREIWKYVLAGLLILMLVEVILQQRFARVAR